MIERSKLNTTFRIGTLIPYIIALIYPLTSCTNQQSLNTIENREEVIINAPIEQPSFLQPTEMINHDSVDVDIDSLVDSVSQQDLSTTIDVQEKKFLFYGDSITVGIQETRVGYAYYVENYLNDIFQESNVIISGHGGKTATYGYDNLEEYVLSYNPDMVALFWGMNDIGGCRINEGVEQKVNQFRENLEKQIRVLLYNNIDVVVMTVTPILGELQYDLDNPSGPRCDYNADLERIASVQRELVDSFSQEDNSVYLIDTRQAFWNALEEGRTRLWSDIVHPGREGSWIIAREILDFFELNPPYENPYN